MKEFDRLLEIMKELRGDGGCAWDREQTYKSLTPYLLEEAHEVFEAILEDDREALKEELGDLLLQVVFLSRIAEEEGSFICEDVVRGINEKLIRRHPHVFGESDAESTKEILSQWEDIKKAEKKGAKKERLSILDGVPKTLPALSEAVKLRGKAARVGFDFPDVKSAFDKVKEELAEFEEAIAKSDHDNMEEEIGDILFTLVNVSDKAGIDAEGALKKVNSKFRKRFFDIEEYAKHKGVGVEDLSLEEMDKAWEESKRISKKK